MYYNPTTKERISHSDLKNKLNASIPYDIEVVESGDDPEAYWYLIHNEEYPEHTDTQVVELTDELKLVDGKYYFKYLVRNMTETELAEHLQQIADEKLQNAKQERSRAVANIRVVVDDMEFDGDETAQERMARVAAVAGTDEQNTVLPWVLADNTVANVTVAQIKEALRKALYAQAALWVKPYTEEESE